MRWKQKPSAIQTVGLYRQDSPPFLFQSECLQAFLFLLLFASCGRGFGFMLLLLLFQLASCLQLFWIRSGTNNHQLGMSLGVGQPSSSNDGLVVLQPTFLLVVVNGDVIRCFPFVIRTSGAYDEGLVG